LRFGPCKTKTRASGLLSALLARAFWLRVCFVMSASLPQMTAICPVVCCD
jgi:hypothetical protein